MAPADSGHTRLLVALLEKASGHNRSHQLWSCFLLTWPPSHLAKVPLNILMVLGIHQLPPLELMVFHAPSRLPPHSTCPMCCSMCSPVLPAPCRSLLGEEHTGPVAKGRCPLRSRAGRSVRFFPGGASGPRRLSVRSSFYSIAETGPAILL